MITIGVAAVVIALLGYFIYKSKSKSSSSSTSNEASLAAVELKNMQNNNKKSNNNNNNNNNNDGAKDVQYLLNNMDPNKSTHLDILLLIATTPENISMTQECMKKEEQIIQKKKELVNGSSSTNATNTSSSGDETKESNNSSNSDEFDLGGDWGDDEEDESNEEIMANKKRQAEKEKLAKEVAAASGKTTNDMISKIQLECIDEKVLGQKWVERTLTSVGQWPPKGNSDAVVKALVGFEDNVAMRRNLCMTMGRLNSHTLNTHPELQAAGPKQMIDNIYFQSSMEYRKRTIVLLEAALRIIGSTRSYKLYKTLVECYTMFKIGVTSCSSSTVIESFQKQMEKTFDGNKGIPRLIVSQLDIVVPSPVPVVEKDKEGTEEKEPETPPTTTPPATTTTDTVVAGEISSLELSLHRVHGENFMKQKIAMAMKQGIPPQIALQTFREGWWILLRCEKLNDASTSSTNDDTDFIDKHPILSKLSPSTLNKYKNETQENRLINAWPFVVSNMKQTDGKVKVRFMVPKDVGNYKFYIDVKSQEYLGCDQTFTLEKEVVVVEDEKTEEDVEPKKTK
jgi:hypothetical protein